MCILVKKWFFFKFYFRQPKNNEQLQRFLHAFSHLKKSEGLSSWDRKVPWWGKLIKWEYSRTLRLQISETTKLAEIKVEIDRLSDSELLNILSQDQVSGHNPSVEAKMEESSDGKRGQVDISGLKLGGGVRCLCHISREIETLWVESDFEFAPRNLWTSMDTNFSTFFGQYIWEKPLGVKIFSVPDRPWPLASKIETF